MVGRLGVTGLSGQPIPIDARRRFKVSGLAIDFSKHLARGAMARRMGQRLPGLRDGFLDASEAQVEARQIIACIGETLGERERAQEAVFGLVVTAECLAKDGMVVEHIGAVRIELEGTAIFTLGTLEATAAEQQVPEIAPESGVVRRRRNR